MSDVLLRVGGMLYSGWTSVRVRTEMARIFGTFSLSVTERWSGRDEVWPIRPGDECQVLIGDAPVITGYVDDVDVAYDRESHSITVNGRDKTGDLVDCSSPFKTKYQWEGKSLTEMARILCEPFDIEVEAAVDVKDKFKTLATEPGQSVFEALDLAAKVRGVLLMSDGNGKLVIGRSSDARIPAALYLGDNVLACTARSSIRDRFSLIRVVGQSFSDDLSWGATAILPEAEVEDVYVKSIRFRPLTIVADKPYNRAECATRAKFERNVRYGRSREINYIVQGWGYETGNLWPVNRLVTVRDDLLDIDSDMLITAREFILDDSGTRTELTVMPREAFDVLATPEPDDGGADWENL